jgi:hypothetical protein
MVLNARSKAWSRGGAATSLVTPAMRRCSRLEEGLWIAAPRPMRETSGTMEGVVMPPMARRQARRKRGRARSPPHRAPRLKPTHLNAARIDVGTTQHWVAVPADRDAQPVRPFGAFTADLYVLAEWLRQCGIDTVAMEATGVYVRRITARAISLAEGTGPEGNPWVNDSPSSESQKGTAACRRSGAAQKPCMVRLCQTRVLW